MSEPSPISLKKPVAETLRDFRPIQKNMLREIHARLEGVRSPDKVRKIVADVVDDLEVREYLTERITAGGQIAMGIAGVEVVDKAKVDDWLLHRHWQGDDLSLSQRIARLDMIDEIAADISKGLKTQRTVAEITRKMDKKVTSDLPGYIDDLITLANRQDMTVAGRRAYKKSLRKARDNIDKLTGKPLPGQAIKKSYGKLVDAIEANNVKTFDKAIARSVRDKARSNVERIARTEYSRAYASGFQKQLDERVEVVGWQSVLSGGHNVVDICDTMANTDQYGLGAGVFPKSVSVSIPYHPNCLCQPVNVYKLKGEPEYQPGKAAKYNERRDIEPTARKKVPVPPDNAVKVKGGK